MKHSIRMRFTIIFLSLTAFSLIMIWAANSWYLESFYLMDKIKALEEVYLRLDQEAVNSAAAGKTLVQAFEETSAEEPRHLGTTARLLRQVSETYNLSIVISDSVTGETLMPYQWDGDLLVDKVQRYIFGDVTMSEADIMRATDNYTIQKTHDAVTKSSYLESWGYFSDNRTIFIISTPLASIQESVIISNRFLAYVGIITLAFSSIIVYVTTSRITRPIKQLATLSERMSNLDFEAAYEGKAEDEVGVLGYSMNKLSDFLKDTIGELKSANHELQRDIEKQMQIDELRKDFIANVSHELKTPIALIQGYAEGLVEGMCQTEESRDYYCHVIMDEANKMNKMVKQLLSLTAIEFGKDQVIIERFNIVSLISAVISSMDIMIQQNDATIIFAIDHPVYVWADEFKIEQVIMNYLSNALNHLAGDKKITIEINIEEERCVKVFVSNTGNLIPEASLSQIWTKFYKVDQARTREYGGSGIGLSIVKAIMDSHHQRCGVYNKTDHVTFWFTLEGATQVEQRT